MARPLTKAAYPLVIVAPVASASRLHMLYYHSLFPCISPVSRRCKMDLLTRDTSDACPRIPDLPFELERDIFELTAKAHPKEALTSVRVARRVQTWIEPLIYETVILDFPMSTVEFFIRTLDSRPASFFRKYVKNISLTSIITFSQASRILSVCTGAVNISCWAGPIPMKKSLLPILRSHPLQRLSVKLEDILDLTPTLDFSHSLFQNLTHLEIVNPPSSYSLETPSPIDWSGLLHLPNITHLAFGDLFCDQHLYMVPVFGDLLSNCESLQTLVLVSDDALLLNALQREHRLHDYRLVALPSFHFPYQYVCYWDALRQGEPDMWERADEIKEHLNRGGPAMCALCV